MTSRARENRLRRAAWRRGLTLSRSRRRDPGGLDFGLYALLDHKGCPVNPPLPAGFVHSLTLDAVEAFLAKQGKRK
jgi:hypothetical protein